MASNYGSPGKETYSQKQGEILLDQVSIYYYFCNLLSHTLENTGHLKKHTKKQPILIILKCYLVKQVASEEFHRNTTAISHFYLIRFLHNGQMELI